MSRQTPASFALIAAAGFMLCASLPALAEDGGRDNNTRTDVSSTSRSTATATPMNAETTEKLRTAAKPVLNSVITEQLSLNGTSGVLAKSVLGLLF